MALGVRVEAELERRLDQLAQLLGKTRSACIREAITQYLSRHGDAAEARRQSEHLAEVEPAHWSEQLPDWDRMTATPSAPSPAPSGRRPWCGSPWSPRRATACANPPS
jgi:predicted transcriptional regulator